MAVSFAQNGTVDWTSLTSMTVSVPLTLMSRLSQAGVDQYTLELVKFYGQFINLPSQHLEVVEKGLLQAKKFGFSANALFVGTGISLVPSLLARTRGGIAFAAVTMALRASFEANFTARVLSEWLSFFERPAELSLPSVSQLQAVGNEVAGCPIDPEIGRVIWGLEQLIEKNTTGPRQPNSSLPRSLISPPHAQDLASAIHTIVTIRPSQTVVMRFKSSVGPSATWLAAFASKSVGLSVSLEIGNKIVWEQQEKYSTTSGSRGHLRLVIEASINPGSPKQLQVLKSASVEITLQRQESNVETSFRIPPQLVVDRMLENIFDNAEQQSLARECICKAAYHLSQKPAIHAMGTGNTTKLTPMYLINKNQTKTALMLLGIDFHSIDLWTAEAKAIMAKGQPQKLPNKNGPLPKWTMEEDLADRLGLPFLITFKKLHDVSQRAFLDKESEAWTKLRLDDFKRILQLWTVLAFVSVLVPGKDIVSLDGRACHGIEISNGIGIFSSFDSLWRMCYCKLNDQGFMEYAQIQSAFGAGPQEGIFQTYCLSALTVHIYAFNLLGGYMDLIGSSNADTAGLVSGGSFAVMSTLLESNPARPRDAMTIFVGQGAIFVNQQAAFCLKSLTQANAFNQPPEFKTSSEFQRFGRAHQYIPGGSNDLSDLTQIKMNMSLYVSEKPDISHVAWSLSGRDGTDVLFDILLTPHQILHNLIHAKFIDFETPASHVPSCFMKKPLSERYKPDKLIAENVEELCSGRTAGLAHLVMTSKNHTAQVLALHYAFCKSLMVYVCPFDQLESVSPRNPGKAYVIVT